MLSALPLAFAQLADPRIRRLLVKSLLLTLALFAAAAALVASLLTGADPCGIGSLDGACEIGAGSGMLAAVLLGLAGLWFLFPAIAIGVIGFFADEAVAAVEARHYPQRMGRDLPFGRSVAMGLRSFGRIVLWNLLAAPFYLVLLATGIGPFLLLFADNALALGRDLGEMVAARHLEGAALKSWLAATRLRRALLGLAATLLFIVPVANLLAPVVSAAAATHLFHRERGTA